MIFKLILFLENSTIPENGQLEEMTEAPIEVKHYANSKLLL